MLRPALRIALLSVIACAGMTLAGCSGQTSPPPPPQPALTGVPATAVAAPSPGAALNVTVNPALEKLGIRDVVIVWKPTRDNCQTGIIGLKDVALDPCERGPATAQLPPDPHGQELTSFVNTYAPFEADTPGGVIRFTGRGTTVASPPEQRMIVEWSAQRAFEAKTGRPADTVVLSWRRERGAAGVCDEAEVDMTGDVVVRSCKAGQAEELGRGRLTTGQLAQFYDWYDALKNFEINRTDAASGTKMRLAFAGGGTRAATPADQRSMQDFLTSLTAGYSKPAASP